MHTSYQRTIKIKTMHEILILTAGILSLGMGLFLYRNPIVAIEIQKKFYEKINWRMEPISLAKEIRNTKLMGLFLMAFVLLAAGYTIFCRKFLSL